MTKDAEFLGIDGDFWLGWLHNMTKNAEIFWNGWMHWNYQIRKVNLMDGLHNMTKNTENFGNGSGMPQKNSKNY